MSKREEELEERVKRLEDVCSDLFDILGDPDEFDYESREMILDARAVWLREGEIEDDYEWRQG